MTHNRDIPSQVHRQLPRAFLYASEGLWHMLCTQRNMRIHLVFAVGAVGMGLWGGLAPDEWTILALTIGFVFVAEALNTAIETIVDLIQPTFHPQAKIAKDVAAGGVLIAALTAVVVGISLFAPHLLSLFSSR